MGSFFRRVFAFLLGMIFATVLLVGGTAGFGYWAFKNLTLKDAGAEQEGIGELNNLTIEEWVALYNQAQKDPQAFTLQALEDYGFSSEDFLASLGVDIENADVEDINVLKQVAPLTLIDGGSENIPMALLFALIPKDKDGKYPFFSKHARDILRNKPLSIVSETDKITQKPILYEYICDLGIGAILSQNYEESYDSTTATYVYTSTDKRFNLFGNVKCSIITDTFLSGKEFNFGKEVNGGKLNNIGQMHAKEFLASIMSDSEETYNEIIVNFSSLQDTTVAELFKLNEENNEYEFNLEPILEKLDIGTFMGYVKCTNDSETCTVNHTVDAPCGNGVWFDADGNCIDSDDLAGRVIGELYNKKISELSNIDVTELLKGNCLGDFMGYTKGTQSGYCDTNCNIEHEHNYYWLENSVYVGEVQNSLSNIEVESLLNGEEISIQGVLGESQIGVLLDFTYIDGKWYKADNTSAVEDDSIGKILNKVYSKTINDLSNGDVSQGLFDGIYLGEFLNYTKNDNNEWIDKDNQKLSVLNEALANILVVDLIDGNTDITAEIGGLDIGEVMGYTFDTEAHAWFKGGTQISKIEEVIANKKLSSILNSTLDIEEEINDLYLKDIIEISGDNKILSVLGDTTIKNIPTKVETLTVGDVLDTESSDTPQFLKLLKDKNINNIGSEMNKLKIGDICGYTYNEEEGLWYNGESVVKGINQKMAKFTLEEISDGEFSSNNITIGDVVDEEDLNDSTKVIALIEVNEGENKKDIPVGDLTTRMSNGVKNSTYRQLEACGVVTIEKESTLNTIYGGDSWKDMKLDALIEDLISKIELLAGQVGK